MRKANCTPTERALKLWILDADVIIDLLSLEVFEILISHCELYLSSTVIEEVQFYKVQGQKRQIDFRSEYVETGQVQEKSASANDLQEVNALLPPLYRKGIGAGELESLAVLHKNRELIFCSMDGLAIKSLPFLDLTSNGISVEKLLHQSGISVKSTRKPHTEEYFQSQLRSGQELKMYL